MAERDGLENRHTLDYKVVSELKTPVFDKKKQPMRNQTYLSF